MKLKEKINNKSLIYSVSVLILSWTFTILLFQNEELALKSFALVMFVPLITSIIFGRKPALKLNQPVKFFSFKCLERTSFLLGIFLPIVLVMVIAIINLSFGISDLEGITNNDLKRLVIVLGSLFPALISAYGEEAGWRGYLLPSLAEKYSYFKATIITGIVWALFHLPVVYLLSKIQHVPNPEIVSLVQAGAAFSFSFIFAYLFFKSNSLIPVVLLHAFWNVFNPFVLGNLYKNEPGLLKGDLFIQNGEGIMGLMIITMAAIYFGYKIKKMEKMSLAIENGLKMKL